MTGGEAAAREREGKETDMGRADIFLTDLVTAGRNSGADARERQYVIVEEGVIAAIAPVLPEAYEGLPVTDCGRGVMIPAFSDLHIHAPQYPQRGLGMDCLLFEWLNAHTFPGESGFADTGHARRVYACLIRDMLRDGTMHASFFTTLHYDACLLLYRMLEESGMQAFCGITNMDRNTADGYVDTTEESLGKTERFLRECGSGGSVRPILTPRFAPTCTEELLKGLGRIGRRYGTGMQTHLVESRAEAEWARSLFPECASDGEIYERCGLLENGPVLFAHTIFPTETEYRILSGYPCIPVHCPDATTNITAGIMPFSGMLEKGIRPALGTDVGGGHHTGIFREVSRAVQLSKMKEYYEPECRRIRFADAFAAATAAAEPAFPGTGRLAPGYRFDALLIDGMEDEGAPLSPLERLERFCYIGDDRNIAARFLGGRTVDPDEVYARILRVPPR